MRHRIWLLLVPVLFLAPRAALAEAPLYVETFDDDLAGWTSLGEASLETVHGALDNRGYMEARRDNRFPPQHRITSEAGTLLTGSLAENFESNQLVYTFYARILHPEASFPVAASIESGETWWIKQVGTADPSWQRLRFRLDTEWTDAEAKARGWTPQGKKKTWKDVCRDCTVQSFVICGPIRDDQRPFVTGFDNIKVTTHEALAIKPVPKGKKAPEEASYAEKVRTMLDNLIEFGRDRYGEESSPLFAAILDQDTLDCPPLLPKYAVDPVRLDPGRYENRANPGGSDVYHDQALFKTLDLMTRLTGDSRYRQAALDALRFAMNRAVDSKGFPALGGHMYWDLHDDQLRSQCEYHEFWNWPLAWDLWWDADSEAMKRYARLMWQWHVCDKSTGETNRHSDGKKGGPFTFSSASVMSQWGFVASRTQPEPYRAWSKKVSDFHWSGRDPNTGLFGSRGPGDVFTTMQATVARDWIVVGRQTGDDELVRRGRAILDGYAKYGYDASNGRFHASLNLDGAPFDPGAERGLVTGDQPKPPGYLAVWQPHAGWQEEPLAMAQVYAWAAEHVDRGAYLPTAKRFGDLLQEAWQRRYGQGKDWDDLRALLAPLDVEYYKIRGVLHSRQRPGAKVDAEAMQAYREGGYVYQAPFGLFADHYGRMIQFSLNMHRLTGEDRWIALAEQVAQEADELLWREKIFVGHPLKKHYMNTDNVGILLYALLQLEEASNKNTPEIQVLF